jgi:hypothetical protein
MSLSLVIPVYNEEQNLPLLMEQIFAAMQSVNQPWTLGGCFCR